jgi:phosphotransferase system HPr (HPr) family protein
MKALKQDVTIVNSQGMHARPAMQLVEIANRFNSSAYIRKGDRRVNAKSIMEVMTLEAVRGSVLTVEAEGADAEGLLAAIAELVRNKFYEE